MISRVSVLVVACASMALLVNAHAADGDVVEGSGEAQIVGGDVVAAKKAATTDALRRCIEKVVGISIQSDFSNEQREIVTGSKDEFYSSVRDSITQHAEGFVQSYDVVSEGRKGDVFAVTLRARVFESKIKSETKKLADLIIKAGNPKLMLVIQEVYSAPDGTKRVARESVVAAYLEKQLIAQGLELRGASAAKGVVGDAIEAYDKWLDDAGGAAKLAREQDADILIAGRVEIRNQGVIKDAGGLAALEGQTRIEIVSIIRGINSATSEVIGSKPVQMTSIGTNEERALHRALQGRGANVIKQTFDDLFASLKDSFKKAADQGQTYVIQLRGVTSFRKQGQAFLDVVKALSGISSVQQKSFSDGQLVLDVAFKGSANDLQQGIFGATSKAPNFETLDIENVSGKQLSFKL